MPKLPEQFNRPEQSEEQSDLAQFKQEVVASQADEINRRQENHLGDIDVEQLTEVDMQMFYKVLNLKDRLGQKTDPTADERQEAKNLLAEYRIYSRQAADNNSRLDFAAFLGNQLQTIPAIYFD